MTKREEYDQLASELAVAWDEATRKAKEGEEILRQLKTEIEDDVS